MARHCGLKDKLGVKGKTGVLASKVTRAAFLCQPGHRVTFHFTPRHASWLNQIEIWRNIVVESVDVYALLDHEFRIGAICLRGSESTRPCHVPSAAAGKTGFAEAYGTLDLAGVVHVVIACGRR